MVLRNKKLENKSELLNENIPFSHVLLVDGEKKENVTKQEALNEAKKNNLDLFCVAPSANPPVCKLINYQKHLFELGKKKKSKKESTSKEIRISFKIEENDLKVKLNKILKWIEEDSTVKVNLVMVGKEKTQQEIAHEKCQKIIEWLQNRSAKIELKDNIRQHFGSLYFILYKKKH